MEATISFTLGILSSIAAYYIINFIQKISRREKIKIEGHWGEFIPMSTGHRYSLGKIHFDKKRSIYAFDGTNYCDDGKPFCHWETVASHVDVRSKKFFYTFTAQVEGQLDTVYYGFGVLNLVKDQGGALIPIDGHYTSANVDGTAMSHSVVRMHTLQYDRRSNGTQLVQALSA